jgi:hypothetical protein
MAEEKAKFIDNIQRWVKLDNQIKNVNEKVKRAREVKNKLLENIVGYVESNQLEATKIEISDGELRFYEKKEYNPLTFGYIEKCLANIIPDKTNVDYIIAYLKENRETSTSADIRRIYKSK